MYSKIILKLFPKKIDQATVQILNDEYGFDIREHKMSRQRGDVFRTEYEIEFNDVFISNIKKVNRKLNHLKVNMTFVVAYVSFIRLGSEVGSRTVDMPFGYTIDQMCHIINKKKLEIGEVDLIKIKCMGISFDRLDPKTNQLFY